MSYYLFIDDERFPPNDAKPWEIVRSSKEACDAVECRGMPTFISFDHDLGGDDTAMRFLHWLTDHVLDHGIDLSCTAYTVHSQNPVGRDHIIGLMENLRRATSKG